MSPNDLKQQTLDNLRRGLDFLPGSNEASAALVIHLHMEALRVMKQHGYLSAEDAVMEVRKVYAAVEAAHPGRGEALGMPNLPDALKPEFTQPKERPMPLRPLFDRVVIRRDATETVSAGGIALPGQTAEQANRGMVVAVGPGIPRPTAPCRKPW